MIKSADIETKMLKIISEFTSVTKEELLNMNMEEASIDSLAKAELLFRIEDEFKITILDSDVPNLKSFSDLIDIVDLKTLESA